MLSIIPASVEDVVRSSLLGQRGRGIARLILAVPEAEAIQPGYTCSVLETAVRQSEAIAPSRACGDEEIEAFGPYLGSTRSVCFGKTL